MKRWESPLFDPDPAAYLPHRFPFLFLDRITALERGSSARALIAQSWGCGGRPMFFSIEAMAQLAGIAAAADGRGGGSLAAIDRAELHGDPGDGEVTVSVRVIKSFSPLHLVEGEVTAGDRLLARATLTIKVGSAA